MRCRCINLPTSLCFVTSNLFSVVNESYRYNITCHRTTLTICQYVKCQYVSRVDGCFVNGCVILCFRVFDCKLCKLFLCILYILVKTYLMASMSFFCFSLSCLSELAVFVISSSSFLRFCSSIFCPISLLSFSCCLAA